MPDWATLKTRIAAAHRITAATVATNSKPTDPDPKCELRALSPATRVPVARTTISQARRKEIEATAILGCLTACHRALGQHLSDDQVHNPFTSVQGDLPLQTLIDRVTAG